MSDNLDGMLSPFLRARRLRAAAPHIRGRVLDYGCGIGLLCEWVGAEHYVGVDVDEDVLNTARARYPGARFYHIDQLGALGDQKFDSVVGLAVIEHLPKPAQFLADCKSRLHADGQVILTTPAPALDWAHGLGARLGLFAKESHDEHQSLMGRKAIESIAASVGLSLKHYERFLLGANQLAILVRP